MEYIVDRFEEEYVVLEDSEGRSIDISRDKFKFDVNPGDVVIIDESGRIILDENKTKERKNKIDEKIKDLWI